MARKPRIHFAGAFYHVMLRGNGGDNIFFIPEDRKKFLALLSESVDRFNCRIHAFCLMTNHVHLAIQVGEISLSDIIQNISFRYTRMVNKKRNKIGHLFQGRYKAILVDADNYLLYLVQYIHLNPIRAKMVSHPENYRWSSHKAYLLGNIEWLTTSHVLSYFSQDNNKAISLYKEFITEDIMGNAAMCFDISNKKTFPVVCDDAFMKSLELIQSVSIKKSRLTLKDIGFVCAFYQIEEMQLHTKSRAQFNAKVRAMIAGVAKKLKVATSTHVAVYFNRNLSSISRILNRLNSKAIDEIERFINARTQA